MVEVTPDGFVSSPLPGPRFQREHARESPQAALERTGGTVLEYHREQVREARIVGFSAGVVVGVAWMLVVTALAVHFA